VKETSPQYFHPHAPIMMHGTRLPHWQQMGVCYFVTWRLSDALPHDVLVRIRQEWGAEGNEDYGSHNGQDLTGIGRRMLAAVEEHADAGYGSCLLKESELRLVLEDILKQGHGSNYHLHDYVLMPNHVHVLVSIPSISLDSIVRGWKGISARVINRLRNQSGKLWQRGYWDRMVRDDEHFTRCKRYIRANPAKANLHPGQYSLSFNSTRKEE